MEKSEKQKKIEERWRIDFFRRMIREGIRQANQVKVDESKLKYPRPLKRDP